MKAARDSDTHFLGDHQNLIRNPTSQFISGIDHIAPIPSNVTLGPLSVVTAIVRSKDVKNTNRGKLLTPLEISSDA